MSLEWRIVAGCTWESLVRTWHLKVGERSKSPEKGVSLEKRRGSKSEAGTLQGVEVREVRRTQQQNREGWPESWEETACYPCSPALWKVGRGGVQCSKGY